MIDAHSIPLGGLETFLLNVALLFIMGGMILEISKNKNYGLNFALFIIILFSVVGRLLLNPIPNIQPVSALLLLTGIFLGYKRAILAGFAVALLSNLILGNGLWTIYQGVGWATIGIIGAKFSDKFFIDDQLQMNKLILGGAFSGILFNWIVSLSILHYIDYNQFPLFIFSGLLYDLIHACGNIFFVIWLATPFQSFIENRYQLKINTIDTHKILKGDNR